MNVFSDYAAARRSAALLLIAGLTLTSVLLCPAQAAAQAKQDNSGTNPANFTYDYRWYPEMAQLPHERGSMITNTFELRLPLGRDVAYLQGKTEGDKIYDMGRMFQLRFRGRYQNLSLTDSGAGSFGASSVSGIGDFDARLLALPYASSKLILAAGLELFMDTASNPALGSGKWSLAPMAIAILPGVFGKGSLFAPAYQYVFSVAGEEDRADISRSQIDIYCVWGLAKGRNWLIVDPQIVLDHKNKRELATAEVEWGFMIAPAAGVSGYVRPGVGIGHYRPYNWNLELGIKFVWR
jgi:hypothetical protein